MVALRLPQAWLAARSRWQAGLLAGLAGGLFALGQAPYSLPHLLFIGGPVLIWLLAATPDWRRAALIGWCAGAGHFALALTWIVEPFLVDIARHGWMAPFALTLMAGGLALFWAAAFATARLIGRTIVVQVLALAALMTLTGYLRAHVFTGFPWALPAYVWTETPVMQTVSLFGPHGLSFLTFLVVFLPGILRPVPVGLALALFAGGWGFGTARLSEPVPMREAPFVVRMVQPNAPQQQKWQPERMQEFYNRLVTATMAAGDVDVTIWPETAVPFLLGERPELQREVSVAARGKPVILGIRRVEAADNWFNSLAIIGDGGKIEAAYDKHHLVPFGEYVPFADQISAVDMAGLAGGSLSGFSAGAEPGLMSAGLPPFMPLICYEVIFPHEVRAGARGADWLVQITNDAWFGKFSGPYQHLAKARSRAIELGLPMARAANTGVSAMIDPFGRIMQSLPLGEQGFVDALLPAPLAPTLYARWGDGPTVLAALLMLAGLVFHARGQRRT